MNLKTVLLAIFLGQFLAYALLFHPARALAESPNKDPSQSPILSTKDSVHDSPNSVTIHAAVLVSPEFANFSAAHTYVRAPKFALPNQSVTITIQTPSPDGSFLPGQAIRLLSPDLSSKIGISDFTGTVTFKLKAPSSKELRATFENITYQLNQTSGRPILVQSQVITPVITTPRPPDHLPLIDLAKSQASQLLSSFVNHYR